MRSVILASMINLKIDIHMKSFLNYKVVIWDFVGVILCEISNPCNAIENSPQDHQRNSENLFSTNRRVSSSDTLNFISGFHKNGAMHIVSELNEDALKRICRYLDISKFFNSINGSPIKKIDIVRRIIRHNSFDLNEVVLISDSHDDYLTACDTGIDFFGYNNLELKKLGLPYIHKFSSIYESNF